MNISIPIPISASSNSRVTSRLRRESIRLGKRSRGLASTRARRDHEPRASEDGCVVLLLLLRLLPQLALLVVLLQRLDRRACLGQVVDHEGHGEVGQAVAPRDLHDDVDRDQIIASIEHANVAFAAANVDELCEQLGNE